MSFFDDLARTTSNATTASPAARRCGCSAPGAAGLSGCATSPGHRRDHPRRHGEAQEKQTDARSRRTSSRRTSAPSRTSGQPLRRRHRPAHGLLTHRPQMPHSYRVLNANYVNAYTFPGGAMGVTRGILADLDDEAQLAALLGHGSATSTPATPPSARGQNLVAQAALAGLNVAAQNSDWGGLMSMGGQIGASALLTGYSRERTVPDRRALGRNISSRPATRHRHGAPAPVAGFPRKNPPLAAADDVLHPPDEPRAHAGRAGRRPTRATASATAWTPAASTMDSTASLRRIRPTIDACKNGETAMAARQYPRRAGRIPDGAGRTPRDYASNLRMAQCLQAQGQTARQ